MIPYFPKKFANKAFVTYIVALVLISIVYNSYAMSIKFIAIGLLSIAMFFYLTNSLSKNWLRITDKAFVQKLFWMAFVLRVAWVVFSYFFYTAQTGYPFEWEAGDSMMYHDEATAFISTSSWSFKNLKTYYSWLPYSDSGYFYYLSTLYSIFGNSIMIVRLIKALLSAFTCVLIYRLASRTFGFSAGRLAAVFCMLMPNMIYYCGLHLKETEMVFLVVAFLERTDYMLRSKRFSIWSMVLPILLAFSLFLFRTVLGTVAVFSFFTALLFSSSRIVGWGKKVLIVVWAVIALGVLAGGTIMTEVESTWNDRGLNQELKRDAQVKKGIGWAKYATGGVMAPMMFVIPFSTMVDVDEQYNQQLIHGGNFVKNVLGIFILFALVYAFFINKKWRDFSLILTFAIAYLGVIAFSGFANAERFHFPALPCLLMLAAYGVTQVDQKNIKFVNYWYFVVVIMELGWAFFKLGSRGMMV